MSRIASIASILFFLTWSMASSAGGQSQPTAVKRQCKPIGRVLSAGDRTLAPGSLLCQGDRLQPANVSTIEVLCYLNQKVLQLQQGSVSDAPDKCIPQATQAERCTQENPGNCPKIKGPGEDGNTPAIISPYSSALLNNRPLLSWYALAGATNYTVIVSGEGVNWTKIINNTTLPYPKEQPAMQLGNAYKITVIGNFNNSPIGYSALVVNLLSRSSAQQVVARVKQINALRIPQDEAAFQDLDTVYMSSHLLSETIETLNSRISAGSRNPTLYRVLGDRYLEAGLPDKARSKYNVAAQLAQSRGNSNELAKAQSGIKRSEFVSGSITRPRLEP